MYLRIMFRKGDTKLKNTIIDWILKVAELNYYNNCYLEDAIESIGYKKQDNN